MIKYLLLIIMSIFIISCNKNTQNQIIISPAGSDRLYSYVTHVEPKYSVIGPSTGVLTIAIDVWNNAVGRELLTMEDGYFPIEVKWVDQLSDSIEIYSGEEQIDAISYRHIDYCNIEIKNCTQLGCYEELSVMIHELGHCIGFAHSINPNSIMFRLVNDNQGITSAMLDIINQ